MKLIDSLILISYWLRMNYIKARLSFALTNTFYNCFFFNIICLVLFSCSVLLCGCGKKEEKASPPPIPEVPVITLQASDIPIVTEFVGQTKGSIDAAVRARVEGVILTMSFEEGKEVTEGQLLYTIDPAPLEAKLAEAKAKLSEANTRLAKAQSDLARIRPLAAMKAVSQRDLDSAIAQEGVAKGSLDAAQAGVDGAQINLGYTKILAPISGIIGLTKARVGEFVGKPPNAVVLNTVSKLDPINVRFSVSENDYLFFARARQEREANGESAMKRSLDLVLSDNSVHSEKGEISSVDSQIDPATGSLAVEATFANPAKIIKPGQFAKVRATRELLKAAIAIPKKAIKDLQGIKQVFIVGADNKVEVRTVKVRNEIADKVVIESGLVAGERIVPEVQQRLVAGALVNPIQ